MIEHGKVILSDDIKEKFFVCNLEKCKGACCVEGDLGAPLEESELQLLRQPRGPIPMHIQPNLVHLHGVRITSVETSFTVYRYELHYNRIYDYKLTVFLVFSQQDCGTLFIWPVDLYSSPSTLHKTLLAKQFLKSTTLGQQVFAFVVKQTIRFLLISLHHLELEQKILFQYLAPNCFEC